MRYAYFDSEITGVDEEGMPIFDRAENSEMLALIFAKLITNGVLAQPANCFQVLAASDSGLAVKVQPGFGMINGRFAYETATTTLTLEAAPTQYGRIDRIVLRCNYLERLIELTVKTGTPAASPRAPELLQPASGDYYELGLATIQVAANQTALSQSAITDTRADSSACGYVTQLIDHLDTKVFFAQFNQFYAEFVEKGNQSYDKFQRTQRDAFNQWFANVKGQLDDNAAGHLQNQADEHEDRLAALEHMFIKNQITAPIATDDDLLIIRLADGTGTKNIKVADLRKVLVGGHSGLEAGVKANSESIKILNGRTEILGLPGAGLKNSIWRGAYLGDRITAAQSAAIRDGSFKDLWLGDYWTIGDMNYRIMHFDYWYQPEALNRTHHVVVVPDKAFYNAQMNPTNVTTGGYISSAMRTSNLNSAKTTIKNAFGSDHILRYYELLTVLVRDGRSTGWSMFDTDIELMSERMVYGASAEGSGCNVGSAKSQLAGFAVRGDLGFLRQYGFWLRDVSSATEFCLVGGRGEATASSASYSHGVRPSFPIY